MNEIYECLEKNFIDWNKKTQETNFNLINENNKSSKGFTLESMKIDYSKNYVDKQNEPIKILQKKRTDLYYEQIKESIVNNNNIWLDKIEEEYLNAFDWKTERNTINSFPWGISSAIEGIYEEKIKENESKNLINWIEFEGVINQSLDRNLQIAWERLYGSFPLEMITMILGNSEGKLAWSKLTKRAKIIVYLVKHGLFKEVGLADYKQKILNFVTDIFKGEEISKWKELLVGAQIGEMYPEKVIFDFPFEAIFQVNSTYGRLEVLYHSEELSSLPDFSKLGIMKNIIGANHSNGSYTKDNLI